MTATLQLENLHAHNVGHRLPMVGAHAERLAPGLFGHDFNDMELKTEADLKNDLKHFSKLTVAEGGILVSLVAKCDWQAFTQWVKDARILLQQLRQGFQRPGGHC